MTTKPDNDMHAECLLIGSILHDNDAFDEVAQIVCAEMFYMHSHRNIWAAIEWMLERNKPVDPFTLSDLLNKRHQTDESGYLIKLMQESYYTKHAKAYAQHVKELHQERALKAASEAVAAISASNEYQSIACKVEAAQNAIMAVSEVGSGEHPKRLSDVMVSMFEQIDHRFNSSTEFIGLKTGICDLDSLTKGLKPGNLVIICGRPGSGKTTLAMNIATHIADRSNTDGGEVLFCSLEMSADEIGLRMMLSTGMVTADDIERPAHQDEMVIERISAAMSRCNTLRMSVAENSDTVASVASHARTIKRKHGLACVVVDYIGLMRAEAENRVNEISEITRGLKRMAMQLGVPVIALAQLNRQCEARTDRRPMLADLRDSGSVEQDANLVIGCYRDSYYTNNVDTEPFAELLVLKNRQGKTGCAVVGFDGASFRFYAIDQGSQARYRMLTAEKPKAKARRGFDDE